MFFILTSCDPAHTIQLTNNTDSNAKVKFVINPKIENYSLKRISTGDSIIFNLKPSKIESDSSSIYFGIGVWDDKEIDELAQAIKTIEIETIDKKTIYKSKRSVKEILEKNKKGLYSKTVLQIDIE